MQLKNYFFEQNTNAVERNISHETHDGDAVSEAFTKPRISSTESPQRLLHT